MEEGGNREWEIKEGEVESGEGERDGKGGGMGREEGWGGGTHIHVPALKELQNITFCALK